MGGGGGKVRQRGHLRADCCATPQPWARGLKSLILRSTSPPDAACLRPRGRGGAKPKNERKEWGGRGRGGRGDGIWLTRWEGSRQIRQTLPIGCLHVVGTICVETGQLCSTTRDQTGEGRLLM